MSKKPFMAAIIISAFLISLVSGMQAVEVAKANPIPYPPAPSTELPQLVLQTPKNYSSSYTNSTLDLNFTITKPASWLAYTTKLGTIEVPTVGDYAVIVYLNGNLNYPFAYEPYLNDLSVNYTMNFSNLTSGQHNATIAIFCTAFYTNPQPQFFRSNMSQTVFFTIYPDAQTIQFTETPVVISRDPYPILGPSPTATPTLTPTSTPTSPPNSTSSTTPSPAPSPTVPEFTPVIILVLASASALIAATLRKRHR